MLTDHYTSTVTISRKVVVGNKTTFASVRTIACHIQPLAPQLSNGQFGRLQKEYLLMSDGEVRIGDKLVDNAGVAYEVFGAELFSFRTGARHYEAQLRGV